MARKNGNKGWLLLALLLLPAVTAQESGGGPSGVGIVCDCCDVCAVDYELATAEAEQYVADARHMAERAEKKYDRVDRLVKGLLILLLLIGAYFCVQIGIDIGRWLEKKKKR